MGRIEEIKERIELNKHVQNLCNNPIREFDMFSSPFKSMESDVEYLLSRLQIAEEALTEIRAITEWAKNEYRKDRERIIYHEANQALEQIHQN